MMRPRAGGELTLPGNSPSEEQRQQETQIVAAAATTRRNISTPVNLNTALVRHQVGSSGRKGGKRKTETIEYVLTNMYKSPRNLQFSNVGRGRLPLHNKMSHVWQHIFHGRDKMDNKIAKILNLVDAVWTPEERQRVTASDIPLGEHLNFFQGIADRCKEAVHIISLWTDWENHKVLPGSVKMGRLTSQIAGTYNRIAKFKVEEFVPEWDKAGCPMKRNDLDGICKPETRGNKDTDFQQPRYC